MSTGGVPRSATNFYPSVSRMVGLLAISLVFTASGIWMVARGTPVMVVAGAAGALFGLLGAVATGLRLILRRPELTVTDTGVTHRQGGYLAWSDVTHARIAVQHTSGTEVRYVQLGLRDPETFYAQSSWWTRQLAKANARLGYGGLNLPESTLGASAEQILEALRHHHPDLPVQS
ncbi:STM3941 family protein [Nocardia neocaledoniensis]|uniref:STM3941 family protein n=1 Tax=Nocardia neocaledoniensis TaxID=236511 RepID=UPI0033DDF8EE